MLANKSRKFHWLAINRFKLKSILFAESSVLNYGHDGNALMELIAFMTTWRETFS